MKTGLAALSAAVIFLGLSNEPKASNAFDGEGSHFLAGGGLVYGPAYEGADAYQLSTYPDLRMSYGDRFFASVPEGIGYRVLHDEDWSLGPIVKYDFGRKEDGEGPFVIAGDTTDDLLGLGDVEGAVEIGGFAEYRLGPFTAKASVRQAISGHEGLVGDFGIDYGTEYFGFGPPLIFSIGPKLRLADTTYHDAYFSITDGQSLASGLSPYEAAGGIVSVGARTSVIMPVTERVAVLLFASFDRLTGDAANSPIVTERGTPNGGRLGLFLSYGL
jgi:outer membrane protein